MSEKNPNYSFVRTHQDAGPHAGMSYIDENEFMNWIQQFQGSDYYNQYLNAFNAYKSQFFSPNYFQELGEQWFNDVSARSNFENQRLSTFYDSLARIQDAQHQETYNSEGAQVERQRQAGLNPDLTGGVSPGQAGNVDNPEMATPALNDGSSVVPQIADFTSSFLKSTLGVYSSLQSVLGMSADLRAKDLNLNGLLTEEAWTIIKDATGEFTNNPLFDSNSTIAEVFSDKKTGEPRSELVDSILKRIDNLPYNKRNKKKLKQLVWPLIYSSDETGYNFTQSYQSLINDLTSKTFKSRSDLAEAAGKIGATGHEVKVGDEIISLGTDQKALRFIGQYVFKPIQELVLDNSKKELEFKNRYFSEGLKIDLPELQAGAEGADYLLQQENKKFRAELTDKFNKIRKRVIKSNELTAGWKLAIEAGLLSAEAIALGKLNAM